jgi:hypothetical protein
MNIRTFLTTVWPSDGPYCIATPWVTPDGKDVYAHRAFDDIDSTLDYITDKKSQVDVYFAIHSLKVARQTNPTTGKLKTYRTHENMKEAKCFFFDLDVGPMEEGKLPKYASQDDAREGLEHFLFITGLPTPFVVSSGGGLHVYWMLDEPIASIPWRTPADKLHFLAKRLGLRADPSRTTDQSSVLRVPNTFNYKKKTPRKVEIILEGDVTSTETFLQAIEDLCGTDYVPVHYVNQNDVTGTSRSDRKAWDGRVTPADEVAEACEQMRIFRDKQGNIPEPHWYVGLGVIKHVEDGMTVAHQWSQGHPNYDFNETQAKIDQWPADVPSCDKIRASCDAKVCERCPFFDKVMGKNPVVIANNVWKQRAAPAPQLTTELQQEFAIKKLCDPPWPFQRTPSGIIEHSKKSKDAPDDKEDKQKFVRICTYDIFPIINFDKTENERGFSKWAVTIPLIGQRVMTIHNTMFIDPKVLSSALREEHLIISPAMAQRMHTFMLAYLAELQKTVVAAKQYDYQGWEMSPSDVDPKGFILGSRRFPMDGGPSVPIALTASTDMVKSFVLQVGSRDKQIELMEFYNDPAYMAQQFMLCLSLGTPLIRLTGQIGFVVNIHGQHSASKSSVLEMAAAVWGSPSDYILNGLKQGSSEKGLIAHSTILRNIPFMIDEITLMEPEIARNLVLGANQAKDPVTLMANRSERKGRGGRKATCIMSSSNKSLVQMVNTDNSAQQAATARIIEFTVERNDVRTKAEADKMILAIRKNFGWLGPEFVQYVIANAAQIEIGLKRCMLRLEALGNIGASERFLSVAGAVAIYTCRCAARLGLVPFDHKVLENWWLNEQLPIMRQIMSDETGRRASDLILGDYLNEINGKTSRVALDAQGNISGVVQIPHNEIAAHMDITAMEVWVRCDPFRRYCQRNGFDYSGTLNDLLKQGVITNRSVRKTMGTGSVAATSRTLCFIVSLPKMGTTITPPSINDEETNVVPFKPKKKAAL